MYMLNMHLSGRAPRLASQLFMAICAEVDKTVRPKHATLVRDKKATEFYRLWCESGLAASRHGWGASRARLKHGRRLHAREHMACIH